MAEPETDEARAVGFTNVKTPAGYYWSFTMRCDSVAELVNQIEDMEEMFTKKKWEAQELRGSFNKFPKKEAEIVPGMKCPTCGNPVVKGKTKDGREFYKCSTQKFDFKTKTTSGCTYFAWINPLPVQTTATTTTPEEPSDEKESDVDVDELPF